MTNGPEHELTRRHREILEQGKAASLAISGVDSRLKQGAILDEENLRILVTQWGIIKAREADSEWITAMIDLQTAPDKIFETLQKKQEIHDQKK